MSINENEVALVEAELLKAIYHIYVNCRRITDSFTLDEIERAYCDIDPITIKDHKRKGFPDDHLQTIENWLVRNTNGGRPSLVVETDLLLHHDYHGDCWTINPDVVPNPIKEQRRRLRPIPGVPRHQPNPLVFRSFKSQRW